MRSETLPVLLVTGLGAVATLACGEDREDEMQGTGITLGSASQGEAGSGSGEAGTGSADAGTTAADGVGTGDADADASADAADGSSGDEKGTVFDLGMQPDVNAVMDDGCDKVDFLFVIDNSGSMGDNQVSLANNFPTFIDGIQNTLENVEEYQVGVVTSDAYVYNMAGCNQLGGLVVRTGGPSSSNQVCGPYADGNYMTEQDDLATGFNCAARVGSGGDGYERPMNAMEIAVRKDLGDPGECNEGFMRDDALLVIVIITDEWDGPGDPDGLGSSGDANSWYDTVVAAKNDIPENIVVLSLVHFAGCPPSDGYMSGDIEPFTAMFGANGFLGCIDSDYGDLFMEATTIIDEACENFVPPG